MNILYLEDHAFFGDSIHEALHEDFPNHTIDYATTYVQAESLTLKNNYDISVLDVILQNGKTGIHFVEKYSNKLGKVLFVTGCKDDLTLKALEKYNNISKKPYVFDEIKKFINNA